MKLDSFLTYLKVVLLCICIYANMKQNIWQTKKYFNRWILGWSKWRRYGGRYQSILWFFLQRHLFVLKQRKEGIYKRYGPFQRLPLRLRVKTSLCVKSDQLQETAYDRRCQRRLLEIWSTPFPPKMYNDSRLQGWYYVKNVSRHQIDKKR